MLKRAFLLLVPMSLAGCMPPPARLVHFTIAGGEVAIASNTDSLREQANRLMSSRCPNGFDVVEEGEVVVGATTSTTGSTFGNSTPYGGWGNRGRFGAPGGSGFFTSNSVTQDKHEWRLLFQCRTDPNVPVPNALPSENRSPEGLLELRVRNF